MFFMSSQCGGAAWLNHPSDEDLSLGAPVASPLFLSIPTVRREKVIFRKQRR
jgi:hypothetical protein